MLKRTIKYYYLFILFILTVPAGVVAQTANAFTAAETKSNSDLTIAYVLSIKADRKNGIAESYNGAIKTVFISDGQVRSRLVSLMRVQSVFYKLLAGNRELITLVKESGKDKIKVNLTAKEWKEYNHKYDHSVVELKEDSTTIYGYTCKRALVKLNDGRVLTVFYTTELKHPMFSLVEPAFKDIPGLVLQYEYVNGQAVFTYTVTGISRNKIDTKVFQLP